MLPEGCKHVVKCPRHDHIVVHATEEGDDNHADSNTCEISLFATVYQSRHRWTDNRSVGKIKLDRCECSIPLLCGENHLQTHSTKVTYLPRRGIWQPKHPQHPVQHTDRERPPDRKWEFRKKPGRLHTEWGMKLRDKRKNTMFSEEILNRNIMYFHLLYGSVRELCF